MGNTSKLEKIHPVYLSNKKFHRLPGQHNSRFGNIPNFPQIYFSFEIDKQHNNSQ